MQNNPYQPPGAYSMPPAPGPAWGAPPPYVPLGWRTPVAAAAIVATCVASFGVDVSQLVFAKDLALDEPPLLVSLVAGLAGLAALGAQVLAVVFFSMWIHRAAKNLPALGRGGMQYTPGWCVGWFFVPFANLVRPARAVSEVWRASDPDAGPGGAWMVSPSSAVISIWWGAWIVSSILANVSARMSDPSASGAVGIAGSVVSVIAAAACISMMRGLVTRQSTSFARMTGAQY